MAKLNWNKAKKYKEYEPLRPTERQADRRYQVLRRGLVRASSLDRKTAQDRKSLAEIAQAKVHRAIAAIRKADRAITEPNDSEQAHVEILTAIYQAGQDLFADPNGGVVAALVKRARSTNKGISQFELLVRAAFPRLPADLRKTWVGVLTYAAEARVRPHKLENFIWIKKGVVKCGATSPDQKRRELDEWRARRSDVLGYSPDLD